METKLILTLTGSSITLTKLDLSGCHTFKVRNTDFQRNPRFIETFINRMFRKDVIKIFFIKILITYDKNEIFDYIWGK